jgi:ribonuclease R
VAFKDRLDAHRMIEEFMVLANVAAARTLGAKRSPLLLPRARGARTREDRGAARDGASGGFTLAKGQVLKTAQLNRLLRAAAGHRACELINLSTLRSMTQAYYSPENFGHFGLALTHYAHFTSPIRRYSDLIVHRR